MTNASNGDWQVAAQESGCLLRSTTLRAVSESHRFEPPLSAWRRFWKQVRSSPPHLEVRYSQEVLATRRKPTTVLFTT